MNTTLRIAPIARVPAALAPIALALATALPVVAADAIEPITVYGKVNVSVESIKDAVSDFESKTDVVNNSSRFGVKGGVALSGSLTAVYTLEWGVNVADQGASGGDKNLTSRNQYVGLVGGFGELLVGRNDTILKQSQGKADLFNDLRGDLGTLFAGEVRAGDSLTYKTPKFNGFQAGANWITEGAGYKDENGKEVDAFSIGAWYGDENLKAYPIYLALAYDSEVNNKDILRATVQGSIGDLVLGGIYQQEETLGSSNDQSGYLLSAGYELGQFKPLVQFQELEDKGNALSLGAEYKLGKPTKAYLFYTQRDYDAAIASKVTGSTERDSKERYLGIGLDHRF